MHRLWTLTLISSLLAISGLAPGCGDSHEMMDGAVPPDSEGIDSGIDGSEPDAAGPDAGEADGGGDDAGMDAGPPDAGPPPPPAQDVDLLMLIDDSGSMSEEQTSLVEQLPRLVNGLLTGDIDGDGTPDRSPARSVHFGVITTDMGVGGFSVPTCGSTFGDDGVLRTTGNGAGCDSMYPPFIEADGSSDPSTVSMDLSCVATAGTTGCGYEQHLESILKALTPSTSSVRFFRDTTGHGDNTNAGFLRDDSLLVVLILSDEDDCSAADPDIFNPSSATYPGELNLRCHTYPEAIHPVYRYLGNLIALRGHPSRLMLASVVGIPVDLSPTPGAPVDYDALLADPRLEERIDPDNPTRLLPSCDVPTRGVAFPPRRILRLGQALDEWGAETAVDSICKSDYSRITESILLRLRP